MEKEQQKEVPKKVTYAPPGQSITADLTYSLSTEGTREHVDPLLVKTHIVCTIGPASNDVEILVKLIKAGMRVARLNFSHGEYEYHAGVVQKVREAAKLAELPVAIMLDTKGPEIRTGKYAPPRKTVEFKAGDSYTWVPQEGFLGDDKMGAISWLNIAKFVKPNDRILVGDGLLAFKVLQVNEQGNVECVVENSGVMGERKNVNLPGVVVDLPAVTDKDVKDIAFGVEQGVDMIAASFIRKREDVAEIRNLPGVRDNNMKATMYPAQLKYEPFSITEIMAMLMKRIANLTKTTAKPSPPFSLKYLLLFSLPSLSSASEKLLAGTATDVADISGESDLVYSDPPVSATIKPLLPDLLQPRVVIYDGVCHLCHRGVKSVIKADKHRKIKFCCVQSKAAEPYLRVCGVDREDVLLRFVFIEGLGLYHQGSTAALRVLSYLPLPYSALSAFLIIPTPLRDAVYDFIAKRRYDWFGKSEDCLVLQESELLERFIDREEMMDRNRSNL